jgi:hypothetical protein
MHQPDPLDDDHLRGRLWEAWASGLVIGLILGGIAGYLVRGWWA